MSAGGTEAVSEGAEDGVEGSVVSSDVLTTFGDMTVASTIATEASCAVTSGEVNSSALQASKILR